MQGFRVPIFYVSCSLTNTRVEMELVTRRVIQRLQKEAVTYSNGQTARSISGVEEGRAEQALDLVLQQTPEVKSSWSRLGWWAYSDIKAYINMDSVGIRQ